MDDYLQCLYSYILDHLRSNAHLNLFDYSRWNERREQAWKALAEALTPEQLDLVENYYSAWCGLRELDDKLLFEAAVSLGKWMARS